MRLEVHKFGGTSLGDAERIQTAASLVSDAAEEARIVVVASAMGGVTDILVRAATSAAEGLGEEALAAADDLLERHLTCIRSLRTNQSSSLGTQAEDRLHSLATDLRQLLSALVLLRELTPRTRDRLLACGEKMCVPLLAMAIRSRGCESVPVDADTFLETDGRFGEAAPLQVVSDRTMEAALRPHLEQGVIPVVTGFCGVAPDGATTTLGRGGSDYTATLIAAALSADEVSIWTDVDGVFSADPKVVPNARVVSQLNYREAAELSYYGAKVLHQRTMIPVARTGIPVRTRNSFRPSQEGTVVDGRFTPGSHPVKGISAVRGQCLVSIEGKGMAGVPGVASRAFRALAEQDISVTMISQSSSECSISLVVPEEHGRRAESALKGCFREDLSHGEVEEIIIDPGVGLVAAVGLGMAHSPGIAGRLFGALGRAEVNVLAIAQGSSELNISLAVGGNDIHRAIRTIHDEFGLQAMDTGVDRPASLDILLLGCGSIGRALIRLLRERRDSIRHRFGLEPRIVGLSDRSGYLLGPTGLDDELLDTVLAHKEQKQALATLDDAQPAESPSALVEGALAYRLCRPVLVDVSDSAEAAQAFRLALERGCDVVTANKKPLAGPLEEHRALLASAQQSGRTIRAEATVGAGLPVIDTLEMLLVTGDRLTRAEGCLSGTLGFLMSAIEHDTPFSQAVAEAVSQGYTEPDPYADLSGADVTRKATILARLAGIAEGPVDAMGLVDPSLAGLSVDEFLNAVRAYDAPLREQVESARAQGEVLRYVFDVTSSGIQVGLRAVPRDSPLGGLAGADNMVVFHSERYTPRPLVIQGPGAGVDVTAMGVLGDILRTAAERSGA